MNRGEDGHRAAAARVPRMMLDNGVGYVGISFHDIFGNPENIRSAAMDFQPSLKRWTSCGCSICFHGPLGQGERTDVLVVQKRQQIYVCMDR